MHGIEAIRARFAPFIIALLWLNTAIMAAAIFLFPNPNSTIVLVLSLALAIGGTALWAVQKSSWLTRQFTAVVAMGQVMLLVLDFAGTPYQIDVHMYFFATLAILAGWLDWRAILSASAVTIVQHLLLNTLYASAIFPEGANILRVLAHAAVVFLETGALVWMLETLRASMCKAEREQMAATDAKHAAEQSQERVESLTRQSDEDRRRAIAEISERFEAKVASVVSEVAPAVAELQKAAEAMRVKATGAGNGSRMVVETSNNTRSNVMTISESAESMRQAIATIREEANRSQTEAESASSKAGEAARTVSEMVASAETISQVVDLIRSIAEQTNLLALNATIESARAGEAGKGFAVVAQEVKQLATQTAKATEEISAQIASMQAVSSTAQESMNSVVDTIRNSMEILVGLGESIEGQLRATSEISDVVSVTVEDTRALDGSVGEIHKDISETAEQSESVISIATQLASHTTSLQDEVTDFVRIVREA
ncbi:hypothetical protein HPQ64_07315 [Rhizobiales bacterium]|uniref:methyl-accepting chemotaxis protein n=1 Tax=Hongsoonwoonella zoysiae TaxID=2821844 RepID=UPI001560BE14|nr:methyl-accepting chemotaxis protein [Hongsoonwoonella zoysiae]NRG17492.1 hypothetical protein [Hongsoonwoonella zoysiae]